MAELSPEAREALAQVLVTHAGYEQSMAEKFAADPKGMSARIFAAGIAFGATARQRQDADSLVERLSERTKMKYSANCKCGHCSCVNDDDLFAAIRELTDLHKAVTGAQTLIGVQSAELTALREQVARLEKNDARYRWLRKDAHPQNHVYDLNANEDLDEAIDAAIAQQQGTPEG